MWGCDSLDGLVRVFGVVVKHLETQETYNAIPCT